MLIDWFTVAAQTVNFLALVWLLKRYLYQPVLDAIAARESGIAATLAAAAAAEAQAVEQRRQYEQRNRALEEQRASLIEQAGAQAKAEGARLLAAARAQAEAARAHHQQALEAEAAGLEQEIARRTGEQVFAITRKALDDLAGQTLEQQMTQAFLARLRSLDAGTGAALAAALPDGGTPALLRSGHALAPQQCAALEQGLAAQLGHPVALRYETAERLVAGIELVADGYQLDWNIDAYLSAMQHSVGEALREHGPAARAEQGS